MEKTNIQELITKWSNTAELGSMSIENLSEDLKENMAILMEAQDNIKVMNEGMSTTSIGELGASAAYKPISLALMRRTFPALFAQNCVGIQAMNTPVGLAYVLRVIYGESSGVNGPEAAWDQVPIYSGFSGSTSGTSATYSTSGAGTGASTSEAEAWKIGTDFPQLKLILESVAITAKSRKLAASFSLEAAEDISAMQNIDIQREIVRVLQYEIIAEMDREIIGKLKTTAVTGTGGAAAKQLDLNATSGTSFVDGRWSQEQISSIVTSIVHQSNTIAVTTRRGAGNFAIVSPAVATALQAARPNFCGNDPKVNPTQAGVAEIGTINSTIKVFRDQYASGDYALVGYKGEGQNDAGVILSPYIMNAMNTATDYRDFSPVIGVRSRYAVTDSLLGAGRYYRLVQYSNLSKIIAGY